MKNLAFVLLAACTSDPITLPSPTPPPSWGVPISGGNLLITRDGTRAVIADPDRDRILTVTLATGDALERPLSAHSEPGRLVEDAAGRVHIALRGTGELLTIAPEGSSRRPACGDPRGVAYDPTSDLVHVACATGELVSLPAAGGAAVRTLQLDRDLRDVIVRGSDLVVTRFRTAELLTVDATGAVTTRVKPPTVQRFDLVNGIQDPTLPPPTKSDATPAVAWRTIALPDGSVVMAHQRKRKKELKVITGGYVDTQCGDGMVESAITWQRTDGSLVAVAPMVHGALPVDVAANPTGSELAFALAGKQTVQVLATSTFSAHDDDECGDPKTDAAAAREIDDELGSPTSVAYTPDGQLAIYYPELPALVLHGQVVRTIKLPGPVGYDSGRALFHRQTNAGLACASCHPEGRDDGQVWDFAEGPRRTQNLSGGVLARAPFHWSGDINDLQTLMQIVFEQRMAGFDTTHSERVSLGPFLDRIPAAHAAPGNADAIARGQALFLAPERGCVTCHMGESYTTNMLVDVGTGGAFKVPSLIGLSSRAPYMHDGCATTLRDRFSLLCGGGEAHGHTATLSESQLADLIAYLESL